MKALPTFATITMTALVLSTPIMQARNVHAGQYPQQDTIPQERVCHFEQSHQAAQKCTDGDIMLYMPINPVGSSRDIIILTSLVCDFRYNVAQTPEALTCVFTSKRNHQWEEFGMQTRQ